MSMISIIITLNRVKLSSTLTVSIMLDHCTPVPVIYTYKHNDNVYKLWTLQGPNYTIGDWGLQVGEFCIVLKK